MRFCLLALAVGIGSGCSTTATVRGTLLYEEAPGVRPTEYRYEATESFDTSGLAVWCGLTAVFYGGACWAYLALPFEDHKAIAIGHARDDANRIGRCVALRDLEVKGGGAAGLRSFTVRRPDGGELGIFDVQNMCTQKPLPPAAPTAAIGDPAS